MATITNKTDQPLTLPLSGGKTLHLGPGQTSEVAERALKSPKVQSLIEAGEVEATGKSARAKQGLSNSPQERNSMRSHNTGGRIRRSGDR